MSEPPTPEVLDGNIVGTDIALKWGTVGGSTLAKLDIRGGDLNIIGKSPFITFDEYLHVRKMLLRYDETYVYNGKTLAYWKRLYEGAVASSIAQKCALWICTPKGVDGFGSRIPYLEDIASIDDITPVIVTYVHEALRNEPAIKSIDSVTATRLEDTLQIEVVVTGRYLDEQVLIQLSTAVT